MANLIWEFLAGPPLGTFLLIAILAAGAGWIFWDGRDHDEDT